MRKLRVGVVGTGGIAQMMHLPTLWERPDLFELVAVADLDREVAEAVGRKYNVRHVHTSARDVIAQPEVEAVLLLASGLQKDAAMQALAAKKHVFVEKPLAFARNEVEAIVAEAQKHPELRVMIGYHKRYDPAFRHARDAVRAMSDLRYVQVTVLHPDDGAYRLHHAMHPLPKPPLAEAEDLAGLHKAVQSGPLAAELKSIANSDDLGRRVLALITTQSLIHDTNLVRGVLGEPEEVLSNNFWLTGMAQSSVTRFAKDVRVNMSWVSVPGLKNYEETLRFIGPTQRVTLVFPSPYLRHLPTQLIIERAEGDALVVEDHTRSYEEAFRLELHHFRNCVLEGKQPDTPVTEALGDARWIEELVRAAK
jgi:predicted dehydrogenase